MFLSSLVYAETWSSRECCFPGSFIERQLTNLHIFYSQGVEWAPSGSLVLLLDHYPTCLCPKNKFLWSSYHPPSTLIVINHLPFICSKLLKIRPQSFWSVIILDEKHFPILTFWTLMTSTPFLWSYPRTCPHGELLPSILTSHFLVTVPYLSPSICYSHHICSSVSLWSPLPIPSSVISTSSSFPSWYWGKFLESLSFLLKSSSPQCLFFLSPLPGEFLTLHFSECLPFLLPLPWLWGLHMELDTIQNHVF